ncbi:Protein pelota-like protein [Colletotrichum sidae]|uniref:Protein DOM34 homolog n=3 Tax=Colletotrichum orbiculare species complex TaxID=2707354 RepID=N4VZW0_COLOR|nr:Protein pelota-like protein [Colletotrichum orbiculare MAFF 240422]TDZ36141.1 Protein pelota-like protein [Colletotrichum spinosum]TEA15257.1 Protein pelota-like protein [Colletotrichum sidae]
MKLVPTKRGQEIDEDAVTLLPEDSEDMWHAYNLIQAEDLIEAHAVRKVIKETETGSKSSERVHTFLTIKVTGTFFDPLVGQLQVSGIVKSENAYVSLGQYHTLDLEISRPFTLSKPSGWDSVAKGTLSEALSDDKDGAMAAVVMQEGIANICLISQFRTVVKQRIESPIPKKRSAATDTSQGIKRFYEKTLTALLRTVNFDQPRPLLLASPGFSAADFRTYIAEQGRDRADKKLMAIAKEAVVIHTNSGHVHSLNEVLKSPEVGAKLKDFKFTKEAKLMDQFFERLRREDGRAWYGVSAVSKAVNEGAVGAGGGVLFVNNSLFRSSDIPTRKKYVALVDKVKETGGEVKILSSDHESGQRLDMLGSVAAILSYPIYDLDEDGEEGTAPAENGEQII